MKITLSKAMRLMAVLYYLHMRDATKHLHGLFLAVTMTACVYAQSTSNNVGYIARKAGAWIETRSDRELVGEGAPVFADSRIIRSGDKSPNDFVLIRFFDGRLIRFSCTAEIDCSGGLDIRRHLQEQRSFLSLVSERIRGFVRPKDNQFEILLARSSSETGALPDALVDPTVPGSLALALGELSPGRYNLELCLAWRQCLESDIHLEVDTKEEASIARAIRALRPGLYQVQVFQSGPNRDLKEVGVAPWWLVQTQIKPLLMEEYTRDAALLSKWRVKDGDFGALAVQRAVLIQLANQFAVPQGREK